MLTVLLGLYSTYLTRSLRVVRPAPSATDRTDRQSDRFGLHNKRARQGPLCFLLGVRCLLRLLGWLMNGLVGGDADQEVNGIEYGVLYPYTVHRPQRNTLCINHHHDRLRATSDRWPSAGCLYPRY